MTFAPDDIEIKEFVPTMRGYDRTEVRSFLRAVAEDVRRLEEKLDHHKQRSLENATAPTTVIQAPTAQVVVDGTALQDAIRELTQAVKVLALHATLPRLGETAPVSTPERAKPSVRGSVLLAGIDQTRSTSTVPQRVVPDVAAPAAEVPAAKQGASGGVWPGPERRSAQRPWSGRPRIPNSANTSTVSTTHSPRPVQLRPPLPVDSSAERAATIEAESVGVPRGSNRELIDAYLQQALHPAQASVDSQQVDTDETAELKGTDDAPRTNVVPLMRAV